MELMTEYNPLATMAMLPNLRLLPIVRGGKLTLWVNRYRPIQRQRRPMFAVTPIADIQRMR